MTRLFFDTELNELHNDLIRMCGLIEEAISKSIKSLENADHNLADQVMEGDKKIDDMESMIESKCLRLIMRQQPVAKDLRAITTAVKMITDMERIGDQAADIAEISIRLSGATPLPSHILKMANIAVRMVSGSIEAFVKSDLELAKTVTQMDDEVDALFVKVKDDIIHILKLEQDSGDDAVDFIMIAKYLERIGDHAVNICEWVEFYETGIHKKKRIL